MPRMNRGTVALGVLAASVAAGVSVAALSPAGPQPVAGATGSTRTTAVAREAARGPVAGTARAARGSVPGPMPGAPSNPRRPGQPAGPSTTPTAPPAAPKPVQPSSPGRVRTWNAGQAGRVMAQVTSVAGSVLMAHGSGQYALMLQSCQELAGAVASASGLAPIPDAGMQRAYAKSLTAFRSGITHCEAGITQSEKGVEDTVTQLNQADLKRATAEFSTGMTDLYIATEFLRQK
jgi:hypothetical protein